MADASREHDAAVNEIFEEFLICRDLGHAWRPVDVKVSRKRGEIHRVLQCRQCPTQRTQILDIAGYPVKNKYDYPEGYALPKGAGRLTVDDNAGIRVLATRRMKTTEE